MKYIFTCTILFIGLTVSGQNIENVNCVTNALDTVDTITTYRTINGVTDTLKSILKKDYKSFEPCRINIFRAMYYDKKGNVISSEVIKTMATGERWSYQPDVQNVLIIEYQEHSETEKRRLKKYSSNKTYNRPYVRFDTTGVIENASKVWMHPMRSNQYIFTEIAPFPEIVFPIEVGKKWESSLDIFKMWGDWNGTTCKWKYKIVKIEDRELPFGPLQDCVMVKSISKNDKYGKSWLTLWYHEDYGFTELNYRNPEGQTLDIKLEQLKYKK